MYVKQKKIQTLQLFLLYSGLSPLYGKLADVIGRKPVLFFAIATFLFGSAMCGAAQNFLWLALCTLNYC